MLYPVRAAIRRLPGLVIKAVPLPKPELLSQPGARNQAGAFCRRNGFDRMLLVTDKTIFALGLHEALTASLQAQGVF